MNTRAEPANLKRAKKSPATPASEAPKRTKKAAAAAEPTLEDVIVHGGMPLPELMRHIQNLESQGQLRAACNLYALWINKSKEPNKHFALFNYGGLLQTANKAQEAIEAYEAAIALKNDFPQPYINLGLLHEKLGKPDQALLTWSRLVGLRYLATAPDAEFITIALNHIGRVQENRKNYGAAEEALEQSLLINPKQPGVIQHWVHIRQKSCKWPVYKELPGITLAELRRATSPLAMLALTEEPAEQLVTSQSFVARTYAIKEESLCKGKTYKHGRTRVGYVSGDFREHAVGFLLPPMLEGHDRKQYELYAYDFTNEENTAHRSHLKSQFDHFRSIHQLDDRKAAELIAADEIDILIDLHGLSAGARPGIFALHPAPLQGTYLGFIGPTGMPWFDFVVADKHVLPEELAMFFTEKPLYVEGSFIPLISHLDHSIQRTRAELGIAEHAFVMGAFGNIYKITPEMFASWMRLLKRIPDSILWLIDDNPFSTANLKEQATRHGVEEGRLLFTPRTAHAEFCARLKLVDVYLDTYPYNCGSTTNDVVNAGVPMVTMYGKTMVSRMGLSILSAVNCAHNVTRNMTEYENKVVELSLKCRAGKLKPSVIDSHGFYMGKALDTINQNPIPVAEANAEAYTADFRLKLFHVPQASQTDKTIPPHFSLLKNSELGAAVGNQYLAIRDYLMTHHLEDDTFYGFFSENFIDATGLDAETIQAFTKTHGRSHDVLIFSPFWDFSSFFLNAFAQGDFYHPGLMAYLQRFSAACKPGFEPATVVAHSDNTVYCNYFIAKKRFWQHWLELGEKLLAFESDADSAGIPTVKVCAQERLVNMVLADDAFQSRAFHPFGMRASATPLNQFMDQAIVANALKLAYRRTGEQHYLLAYLHLQRQVFEVSKMHEAAA